MFMRRNRKQYLALREDARALVWSRIALFNAHYGFRVGKIFIKNHKTRWGSCSEKGNLNFNYKLALLPLPLVDYVVVHELCHLEEFNHSERFWALVGEALPDYRERRKALRAIERMNMRMVKKIAAPVLRGTAR